ncbi:O-antigen ligase family protein [Actinobacillus delphinicola]|uniref:O-antigen polymerase n=1 Tax=Actinobacillus delphinicola TaxID=51161 RepID=A0A448TTD4_9PAST|nr:O-antigen ligase family protein [Actinobacillus delphinicola]VEJ09155.1 O-antigen polymerase [Actinobacillus delphinicola]
METLKSSKMAILLSCLMGMFFIFPLFAQTSYYIIPGILLLFGLYYMGLNIKQHQTQMEASTKILILAFASYLIVPMLSMFEYHGRLSFLDIPCKALLLLPILTIFTRVKLNIHYFIGLFFVACFSIGAGAVIEKFYLHWADPFMKYNRITAGNVAMGIAMLAFSLAIYYYRIKQKGLTLISSLAFISAFMASLLCMNRGALVGFALGFVAVLWLNRDLLSKKLIAFFVIVAIASGGVAYKVAQSRWNLVDGEIAQCVDSSHCDTSIGIRLQLYKSALRGMEEKPILGWGVGGTNVMRQQQAEEGFISHVAGTYTHAHNIFLEQGSKFGILGLLSLLSVFLVPMWIFAKNIKVALNNPLSQVFGIMGITFIITIMGCGLTDVLMRHRIGNMFYFTTVILLIGFQKMTLHKKQ